MLNVFYCSTMHTFVLECMSIITNLNQCRLSEKISLLDLRMLNNLTIILQLFKKSYKNFHTNDGKSFCQHIICAKTSNFDFGNILKKIKINTISTSKMESLVD